MANLGLIPSWQFNMDPAVNPQVVEMKFPDGVYQTTVQPVGPYYGGLGGLGAADQADLSIEEWAAFHNQMRRSWWWQNRRKVMIGVGAALVLGTIGGLNTIFAR